MHEDELKTAIAELRQQQEVLLDEVRKKKKKDIWEKVQALSPLMSGVLISSVGLICTYSYNQQQLKLQTIQTIEKFIPHLLGNEVSKKAAILAMSSLGNTEIAAKFAQLFASEGTVSALKSIAENDPNKDKSVVNKALANALDTVAEQYRDEKKYAQAEEAYKQALEVKERTYGASDPDISENLEKLAQFYAIHGNYTQAEPLLKRSLAIRQRLYGTDNPFVAETMKNLSDLYKLQGNTTESDLYLKKALAIDPKCAQAAPKIAPPETGITDSLSGDAKKQDADSVKQQEDKPASNQTQEPQAMRTDFPNYPNPAQNASSRVIIRDDQNDLTGPAA